MVLFKLTRLIVTVLAQIRDGASSASRPIYEGQAIELARNGFKCGPLLEKVGHRKPLRSPAIITDFKKCTGVEKTRTFRPDFSIGLGFVLN
jgi:hypothetical protein